MTLGTITIADVVFRAVSVFHEQGNTTDELLSMIRRAKRTILIASDTLPSAIWAQPPVISQLRALLQRRGRIDVVCREIDPETGRAFKRLIEDFPDCIHMSRGGCDPAPQGVLVENEELRFERDHRDPVTYVRRPAVAAAMFRVAFETYRRQATPVSNNAL